MPDNVDYTNYFIDLKNQLDSINVTNNGLNESLNQIMQVNNQTAYIMELSLYMLSAFVIAYLIGVMLKITFSR